MPGVAETRATDAVGPLTDLTIDRTVDMQFRLAAADALGELTDTGLTETAEQLFASRPDGEPLELVVIAKMLAGHHEEAARELLLTLAGSGHRTAATADRPSAADSSIHRRTAGESGSGSPSSGRFVAADRRNA